MPGVVVFDDGLNPFGVQAMHVGHHSRCQQVEKPVSRRSEDRVKTPERVVQSRRRLPEHTGVAAGTDYGCDCRRRRNSARSRAAETRSSFPNLRNSSVSIAPATGKAPTLYNALFRFSLYILSWSPHGTMTASLSLRSSESIDASSPSFSAKQTNRPRIHEAGS